MSLWFDCHTYILFIKKIIFFALHKPATKSICITTKRACFLQQNTISINFHYTKLLHCSNYIKNIKIWIVPQAKITNSFYIIMKNFLQKYTVIVVTWYKFKVFKNIFKYNIEFSKSNLYKNNVYTRYEKCVNNLHISLEISTHITRNI